MIMKKKLENYIQKRNKMKNNKLLVLYIGIAKVRDADVDEYMNKIVARIVPNIKDAEIVVLPNENSTDIRIECINPQYITDEELIKKNTLLMYELNYELNKQLNIINDEKKD